MKVLFDVEEESIKYCSSCVYKGYSESGERKFFTCKKCKKIVCSYCVVYDRSCCKCI